MLQLFMPEPALFEPEMHTPSYQAPPILILGPPPLAPQMHEPIYQAPPILILGPPPLAPQIDFVGVFVDYVGSGP